MKATLWGARQGVEPDPQLLAWCADRSDARLLGQELRASRAHVAMLAQVGLLQPAEAEALEQALAALAEEEARGAPLYSPEDEDIHSAVERHLQARLGPLAGRLHTARSRNDLIAADLRLWMRAAVAGLRSELRGLLLALAERAGTEARRPMALHTHLQPALVVSLGHHLLAWAWPLLRDWERMGELDQRLAECPLGAGAGGGSRLPIDPAWTAAALGQRPFANSIDATASRDLAAELGWCCASAMTTLSRVGEELVLWAHTGELRIDPAATTGSSALPQKQNPDVAELLRGRAARVQGALLSLLALQKGLPLAYNRDLQEDKALIYSAVDTLSGSLQALRSLLPRLEFRPRPPPLSCLALDLAELLCARGRPFREAHQAVGALMGRLAAQGRERPTLSELQEADPLFEEADLGELDIERALVARASPGGGSPVSVWGQVQALRRRLEPPG